MRSLLTVISFTIKDMVKRKSFIISNIIIFLMIIIGFNVIKFLGNSEDVVSKEIIIVDNQNIFENVLENYEEQYKELGYEVQIDKNSTRDQVEEKIKSKEWDSVLILTENENGLNFEYMLEGIGFSSQTPTDIITILQSTYQNIELSKLGIPQEKVQSITNTSNMKVTPISSDESIGNIGTMMILSIVLFYAIYFYAYQVSAAITVEKTSRIIETLVTSTSPKIIVLGKTIGIGLIGILQTLVTIAVAAVCAKVFLPEELVSSIFEMTNLNAGVILTIAIYYILGYSLYAMLYALTGSTVSKPEEVQSANGPVAILAVVGFYLSYFTMMNPTSSLNKIASLIPISSPFCMPFRAMMGLSNIGEILISVVILLITIFIIAKISIKIYSSAILNYGEKINIKKMIKMYKSK